MCKRLLRILTIVTFLTFATTTYAASEEILSKMTEKLRRGIVNTFTGWVEFPAQIAKGFKRGFRGDADNKILGVLCGVFDGIGHSIGRTSSGVADLISFWAAGPSDNVNVGIPLDAEYAWERGGPHDVFDPSFTDGALAPMTNKLFRGAGNAIFGFMELPDQIARGFSKGALDFGIFRGLWFWASREISGISDVITAPFPNPEYPVGISFDKGWPWEVLPEEEDEWGEEWEEEE